MLKMATLLSIKTMSYLSRLTSSTISLVIRSLTLTTKPLLDSWVKASKVTRRQALASKITKVIQTLLCWSNRVFRHRIFTTIRCRTDLEASP